MKKIVTAVVLSAIAAPAFAGGPVVVAVEPEVVAPAPVAVAMDANKWAGAYGGLSLGYGKVKGKDKATGAQAFKADDATVGLQAGYRWAFDRTIVGVEGAYTAGDIKDKATNSKLKQAVDLKAQLGYDLGQSLVYATAGYSWAEGKINGVKGNDNGWNVGLGYDYDLGNNWVVGAEYLHRDFNNFDKSGVKVKTDSVALRANYQF